MWKRQELLTKTFSNHVGLKNVKIEKAHRIADSIVSTKCIIVAKLPSYEDKQKMLSKCNYLKRTGIYINEDFSKRTLKFRKNALKGNTYKQGRYAILRYDRIYIR